MQFWEIFRGYDLGTLYVTKAAFSSVFGGLGVGILSLIFPFVKGF